MAGPAFKFNRSEVSGSLGDLGTLVPLAVGLVAVNHVDASVILLTVGLFYIALGLYYRLPIPVQPFKVFAAVAIAQGLAKETLSAGALIMAAILLFIGATNLISVIARLFSKPVIRGIQAGLGLTLLLKGVSFILGDKVFVTDFTPALAQHFPLNLALGIAAFLAALMLINNRRLPAAIALVAGGLIVSLALGAHMAVPAWNMGMHLPRIAVPGAGHWWPALILLALPQLPLTIGNAVIGTRDTSEKLFGQEHCACVTDRALCFSMGASNIMFGLLGGMPCCHGAGGLAAHYRFGARTGGSNIIIGAILVILALAFGPSAMSLLTLIPAPVLGVLLFFAGAELALMLVDLSDRTSLFIAISVAGIALGTRNMGIAFASGIVIEQIISRLGISFEQAKK